MSQFFESIRVNDGIAENLDFHQARINKTLKTFDALHHRIEIACIVQQLILPPLGLFKLKVSYDLKGNYHSASTAYQYKNIQSFALVEVKGHRYDFKFSDRDWMNEALTQSGKDEIMMHDEGLIKDCSYTNLVFYDGVNWVTPEMPLLEGTQRAKLIQEGVIIPKAIYVDDLTKFIKFKCINAMMHWDAALAYKIDLIS
jgi:4-amino-4-deoxychorismate lyase